MAPDSREGTNSRWIKCISNQGNIRGVAIQATGLVKELSGLHKLGPEGVRRLGEAVVGALSIASYCKDRERVNLNIQGTGKVKQALVDAYPDGTVRGYVLERDESGGGESLAENEGPWGDGVLSVLRTKVEQEQPYIGTVPLVTGHLAKDLTFYWAQSEQIPSSVGLAVNLAGTQVTSAGGFLIQAMPGASPRELKAIEGHINEIQSLAERIADNSDPMNLLSQIFQSSTFMLIEERSLQFKCQCSWERVRRALTLVGVAELQAMLAEDQAALVRCDFCSRDYRVSAEDLQHLIDSATERRPEER